MQSKNLVAPYFAIPRDYLSDTRRYGVFGVSTWPIGCDTPSPFSERFSLGEHVNGGAIPPHTRGISAILARYPMKQGKWVRNPPLRYYLERYCAIEGGVSRTGQLRAKTQENIFKQGLALLQKVAFHFLVDVSDIFYFSCSGEGKGESEAPGRWGGDFLLKIPGGGSPSRVGAGGRGAGRVFAGIFGGGGVNIFFWGRISHQVFHLLLVIIFILISFVLVFIFVFLHLPASFDSPLLLHHHIFLFFLFFCIFFLLPLLLALLPLLCPASCVELVAQMERRRYDLYRQVHLGALSLKSY